MKKLPIGIDNFPEIIKEDHCYVDKTKLIHKLATQGKYYFLSRPRRFGKSLLIDTIARAFMGEKKLFKGLFLENHWDWHKIRPVIRIDFAQGVLTSRRQLDIDIMEMLEINAAPWGLSFRRPETHLAFSELIRSLHEKTGRRVVVLVDEYDKPILDNITCETAALQLREGLRSFYSVLKAQGEYLRFVMLTGVSKFSKVSLFSGLNNLEDITLDPNYGTICGYTQKELEAVFHEYVTGIDMKRVRRWYDGYNFMAESVYNPFDVLLYLKKKVFIPYWFETGTPDFLIRLIRQKGIHTASLDGIKISHRLLNSFDVDNIAPEPLLFQTGYLTIKDVKQYADSIYYTLGFPNHEVKHAFNDALLTELVQMDSRQDDAKLLLLKALESNEPDKLKSIFHRFFASIPHDWYRKNDMAGYEGYYCSIVYCYFTALGLDVRAEETTSHGRLDMVVHLNLDVYIFEFKINEFTRPARALAQIKEKKYHEKYTGRRIWLIGVEFSKTDRNITRFEWERV